MEGGIRAAGVRPQSPWAGGVCVRTRGVTCMHVPMAPSSLCT